ncbi:MAG: Hsp20/alpha crystallin family protein [Armatimonadetes bacterium]|nr:Hsp20/alpha crystallin family protein [Armatimonadota bacterium]
MAYLDRRYEDIARLRVRLRSLLDEAFPVQPAPVGRRWTPPADIRATEDGIVVELEVCGMTRESINVVLDGNVLTIDGMRERDGEGEQFLVAERPAGRFSRSFSLAFEPSEVNAALEAGVLTVVARR